MNFALLPPEVNSARMYAGPGAAPLLTAASAWDGLAVELGSAARSYESVVSELAAEWTGPSAGAMATAASRYVTWLQQTAATVEQTAVQVRSAVAAYETAFASTVPPPAVAANRSQLASLVATNVLGQNTPAIAATEALYGEMWVQDVLAMTGYAAQAGTRTLIPFAPPPEVANPAGQGQQATAASQAAGTSAATQALQNLAAPGTAAAGESLFASAAPSAAAGMDPALTMAYAGLASSLFGAFVIDSAGSFGVDSAGSFGIDFIGLDVAALLGGGPQLLGSGGFPAAGLAPVAATVGHATPVGGLSVPPAWAAKAPPAVQFVSASTALASSVDAAPEIGPDASRLSVGEMATAGLAARALAGFGRGRPTRGGAPNRQLGPVSAAGSVTRIAPDLRELANLRDAGVLTEEEFSEHKRLLLGH